MGVKRTRMTTGCNVGVHVVGDSNRGVTEDLGDVLDRETACQQQGGGGVP